MSEREQPEERADDLRDEGWGIEGISEGHAGVAQDPDVHESMPYPHSRSMDPVGEGPRREPIPDDA